MATSVQSAEVVGDADVSPVISLAAVTEIAIAAYFSVSFLHYVKALPLSHVLNLGFLVVFGYLALLRTDSIRMPLADARALGYLLSLAAVSLLSWMLRDAWDPAEVARSLTWMTPAALLLVICGNRGLRHERICGTVAIVSLLANVLVTVAFARFNTELAKFEVPAEWTAISSNELSFHLIAFGFLFLLLTPGRAAAWLRVVVGVGSFVHLSKAHLASAALAPLVALSRRRFWIVVLTVALLASGARWLVTSDVMSEIEAPQGTKRVFEPIRDLVGIASQILAEGEIGDIQVLAGAVGLHRFEVYEDALGLLTNSPVGHSSRQVDIALRGLDPHSNVLYMALREGWLVTVAYIVLVFVFLRRIPSGNQRGRWVLGALTYVFLRSIFVTFDPVKLLALLLYMVSLTEFQIGPREIDGPGSRNDS